jgi:hypothetical protein
MARPVRQTYDVETIVLGGQTPVSSDYIPLTATTIAVVIVTGTAEYSVEFTLDDVNDPNVTPRWLSFTDFPTGTTETKYAAFAYPVVFIRINIAALTGILEFKIAQAFESR